MGIVAASTGHSRPEEKKVANWLYISITVAVVLAAIIFFMMSRKAPLNPTHLDQTPSASAPQIDQTTTPPQTEQTK